MENKKYKNNIYFEIRNNLNQMVRDFRLYLDIPKKIEIDFDEGDMGRGSYKTDNFWMRQVPCPDRKEDYNRVKLLYPSLPASESSRFELGIKKLELENEESGEIYCKIQADNILPRKKTFNYRVK